MRKVEESIINVLKNGSDGDYNLSCRDLVKIQGSYKQYALWGSVLFWNDLEGVLYFSGRGFFTNTTKSRLNNILVAFCDACIHQNKGEWFLSWNHKKYLIDADNIYYFKNNKLFQLETEVYKKDLEMQSI